MRKTGRNLLLLLCVMAMLLSVAPVTAVRAEQAEGLVLETMQIVLPAEFGSVEQTAANELQLYIGKITGKSIAIVKEGENSGAGIYVGNTEFAKTAGVTYPTENDTNGEAWAIQAVDGNLVLCGAEERGALYAVYHLLEDVLGVRWWNPWEEHVPSGSAVVPVDYANSGVPALEYREAYIGGQSGSNPEFFARNRINGHHMNIPAAYGGSEVYGLPAHVHTFNRYFTQKDFAAHPEWFSLDENGQRVGDRQLCLTNVSLQKEFAKRLIENVKKNPEAIFAVCPNDNRHLCECYECQNEMYYYGSSGYVLNFVNKMAKAVAAAGYPDTSIEMLVYWMYVDEPQGDIVPEPNVTIRFADNYTDLLHSVNHLNNAASLRRLKIWTELAQNDVYYWQYIVNYYNNGIVPSMFHYGEDFTTLVELGVNGWFTEQEQCINVDFWDMKLWLLTKLMENPVSGEEYEALMDEFIFGYYGQEAGQYIREYLYYMHEKAEINPNSQTFGTHIIEVDWLDVEDIIIGNELFDKAFEAANEDRLLLRRLRAARNGFDRVAYENFSKWQKQADKRDLTLPFTKRELGERICYTFAEQIHMRGGYDADVMDFYARYDQYTDDLPELPEELSHIAREHVMEYTVTDFRLTDSYASVSDPDSLVGTAACSDSAGRAGSMLEDGAFIIALYNPKGGGDKVSIIGYTGVGDAVDMGYQIYKFDFTVPNIGESSYVYLFNDWGLQIPTMASQMKDLKGKTVEVYVSMKQEGTRFYVDRVLVLPDPEQSDHNYVNDYERGRSVCSVCGDVLYFELEETTQNTGTQDMSMEEMTQVVLMMAVSGLVEVAGFGFLMFWMLKKRRRR